VIAQPNHAFDTMAELNLMRFQYDQSRPVAAACFPVPAAVRIVTGAPPLSIDKRRLWSI